MRYRLFLAGLFLSAAAAGQTWSVGVIGGASLTPDFKSTFTYEPPPGPGLTAEYSASEHYIVGAMFEFQFPNAWSVELDGLFHELHFDSGLAMPNGTLVGGSPTPVVTWELPVLARYRFGGRSWKPFLEAGPSFRTAGNLNGTNPSHYGAAAGVGVEIPLGRFRLTPEVRYIRWAEDTGSFGALTRPDQLEVLTSISTRGFEGGHVFGSRTSLGLVAGATLSPDFQTVSFGQTSTYGGSLSSHPGAFLLGPMFEVAIAGDFFFEADAIHQPLRATLTNDLNGAASSGTEIFNTWTYPLLAKYKFSTHGVRPFLEAGPVFRDVPEPRGLANFGVTAGAGIEVHWWRLAIAPAVRYTHWGRFSPPFLTSLVPFENQVELVAGVSF